MWILSLDLGTTHSKAALIDSSCTVHAVHEVPVQRRREDDGTWVIPAAAYARDLGDLIRRILDFGNHTVQAVSIASMAETGLLLDEQGQPCTELLPWHDQRSAPLMNHMATIADPKERFAQCGIRASFKCSVTKLLWLRDQGLDLTGKKWFSAADYLLWLLTGVHATDPTLANRTYGYSLLEGKWDLPWLRSLALDSALFPQVLPSGQRMGEVLDTNSFWGELGRPPQLPPGTPVTIAGHDHVVASAAVGIRDPGTLFNSMGTAEALLGPVLPQALGEEEYDSGLSFGPHVVPDYWCWMGGLSGSGGSVEWLRQVLSEDALSYTTILELLEQLPDRPTGLLYYPYLSGAGAPDPDPIARGAFIGLCSHHSKAHLLKAVLEGCACEWESLRRTAERISGLPMTDVQVVGGGTKNPYWLRIKATLSGCTLTVPQLTDAVLEGAAQVARQGMLNETAAYRSQAVPSIATIYQPDAEMHPEYVSLYQDGYMALQNPIRRYSRYAFGKNWR